MPRNIAGQSVTQMIIGGHGFTFTCKRYLRSTILGVQSLPFESRGLRTAHSVRPSTSLRCSATDAILHGVVVDDGRREWTLPDYRRPLHWVQKVSHLEDTLHFYQSNFNFKVYRHEEFSSGCEATCNGPYGGAWSKTMVGPEPGEGKSFALELVFNYGVNKYDRGNELRSIAVQSSDFVGSSALIGHDPQGGKFIETPDGHWLNLVDKPAESEVPKNVSNGIQSIDLHVSNLTSSVLFYRGVLGAIVAVNSEGTSATCYWNHQNADTAATGVVLHQLPFEQELVFRASQGRFAIETEDGAPEQIALRAHAAEKEGRGKVVHGPVKLEPHGEEVVIVRDEDGHEYCFVDARGFQRCIDVTKKQSSVDWDYRKNVHKKASADYTGGKGFSESITVVEAATYDEIVATSKEDVLFDLYAPWCILCARNKPVYEELAKRVSEISGKNIVFAAFDGSKTPASLIGNDQLGAMMNWAKTQGFPALFYLRGDDKDIPIEFDGEWTIAGLSSWIASVASSTLDLSAMDMTELPPYVFEDEVDASVDEKRKAMMAALMSADDDDDCGNCSL